MLASAPLEAALDRARVVWMALELPEALAALPEPPEVLVAVLEFLEVLAG
jgi:hypothetical protein